MRLAALLIVAIALPARAAPPANAPPPDPAREHYERGLAKYNLAEFDAAIVEFKQSYELSKAPRLLFNIAQAYRLKKDYDSALYFYSTYLRAEPNPPNLADVEGKIDEMKRAIDEQKRREAAQHDSSATAATASTGATTGAAAVTADRAPPSRRGLRIAGIGVAALGLACVGVGGGMLGLASSDASTLHRVAVNMMPWTSADDALYREGDRAQTAGIVLLSAGGALVVAGGVTLVIALRR